MPSPSGRRGRNESAAPLTVTGDVELLSRETERVIRHGTSVELAREDGLPACVAPVVALDENISSQLQPASSLARYVYGKLADATGNRVDTCKEQRLL